MFVEILSELFTAIKACSKVCLTLVKLLGSAIFLLVTVPILLIGSVSLILGALSIFGLVVYVPWIVLHLLGLVKTDPDSVPGWVLFGCGAIVFAIETQSNRIVGLKNTLKNRFRRSSISSQSAVQAQERSPNDEVRPLDDEAVEKYREYIRSERLRKPPEDRKQPKY